MRSAIAVLTYNRLPVLQEELMGIYAHCSQYPLAIFDDLSQRDGTVKSLTKNADKVIRRDDLMADEYQREDGSKIFIGRRNLGVAANSNRAIKWFLDETDADHLCLLNDDLHVEGDFVAKYAKAHVDLKVGMFSFCDFIHHPSYKWIDVRKFGYIVKICPRMTAIMTSMTRKVVEAIGYYDAQFGKFGQEHCLSGDTPVISRSHGLVNIRDVVGQSIEVWNGKEWRWVTPRKTGENRELVRVRLGDGSYLDCTPDHRFSVFRRVLKNGLKVLSAGALTPEYRCEKTTVDFNFGKAYGRDAYTLGFMVGDGCVSGDYVGVDLIGKKVICPVLGRRSSVTTVGVGSSVCLPVDCTNTVDRDFVVRLKNDPKSIRDLFLWDTPSILNFIAGLADSDGTEITTHNSGAIRIHLSKEDRARTVQLLLTRVGIRSSVNLGSVKGSLTNFGPRSEDLWYLHIPDARRIPCCRLNTSRGRPALRKGKFQTVRNISDISGRHDTFCLTEENEHKTLFSNVLTYQCDHMNRARFAGFMNLDGMMQPQLDIHHNHTNEPPKALLRHQECPTSVAGIDRRAADSEADEIIKRVGKSYRYRHLYRPFCLYLPKFAGAHGKQGIPVDDLRTTYTIVQDFWPTPLPCK